MTAGTGTGIQAGQYGEGDAVIEVYLAAILAELPGPVRAREDILAELRGGLLDAAESYRGTGLGAAAATRAAVREFGEPGLVAAAFRPGLAAGQARRVAITLLATGPLVGLLWAGAATASHIGVRLTVPWRWAGAPPASAIVFPVAAVVFLIAVWAAGFTVAATGRASRWLPDRPGLAPGGAALAGLGAGAADLLMIILLGCELAAAPGTLAPVPITVAAAVSLLRLVLARRAGLRCLATRRALA